MNAQLLSELVFTLYAVIKEQFVKSSFKDPRSALFCTADLQ